MNFQSSTSARTTPSKSSSTACSSSRASPRASSNPSPPRSSSLVAWSPSPSSEARSTLFPRNSLAPTAESPFRNLSRVPSVSIRLTERAPRATASAPNTISILPRSSPTGPARSSMAASAQALARQFSSAHSNSAPTPTASISKLRLKNFPRASRTCFVRLSTVQRSRWRERISREEIQNRQGFSFPGHPEVSGKKFRRVQLRYLSRVDNAIYVRHALRHMPRQASAPRITRGQARRLVHRRFHRALAQRRTPRRRQNSRAAHRAPKRNRCPSPRRSFRAHRFPPRRGSRLSQLGSLRRHTFRRRSPAHPPRHANRLASSRRSLCSRRAQHRPPRPRQRAPSRLARTASQPRQHRSRRRTRRRHHPPRRFRRRPWPRRRQRRRLPRRPGQTSANRSHSRIPHRSIPQRRRKNRRPGKTPQPQRQSHPNSRREREQPQRSRRHAAARPAHRRHRRLRVRQIHACQRHSLSRARAKTLSLVRSARRASRNYRLRAHRQSHRNRSSPNRSYAALESRHLYRRLRAYSRSLCHASGIARTRLPPRPLQLQRQGRPLRSLPGGWPSPHRNEFSSRRLCDV